MAVMLVMALVSYGSIYTDSGLRFLGISTLVLLDIEYL